MNPLSRMLVRIGGYSPQLAAEAPQCDQIKTSSAAASIFVPALIGGAGAANTTFMLTSDWFWTGVVGLGWAGILLVVDRMLVATFKTGFTGLVLAVPRFAFAFLASLIFAHPLVFLVFSGELDAEIERGKRDQLSAIQVETQNQIRSENAAATTERTRLTSLVSQLNEEIAVLTTQLVAEKFALRQSQGILEAEIKGEAISATPGFGPEAERKHRSLIAPANERIRTLQAQHGTLLQQRAGAFAALSELSQIQAANPQIERLRQRETELSNSVLENQRADLLSRFRALHDLTQRDEIHPLCLLVSLPSTTVSRNGAASRQAFSRPERLQSGSRFAQSNKPRGPCQLPLTLSSVFGRQGSQ